MMYLAFIDPNLVRLFGYSSRNQSDKDIYIKILQMRMDAKHNKLSQEFLDNLKISNKDVKDGLKLIINSYTGTLRAPFNNLCDELQGVSICFTGQCLLLQLGYDLMKIPTVHLSRFNTDAVEVSVDEEYVEEVYSVVHEWETLTGLEMEDDKIIKLIARDINNYCGIYKVKNGYEVHYKGGDLSRGKHEFIWDNETHKFKYTFKNDLKSNSLTIVSEALLKNLLFNIPIEDTINKCNDIFRYQLISHLGSTYEKCVQESPNGDIELQRNNRIYAGKKPSGLIVKVKYDGRRDSLANCPPNPIVDNANECTIEDINKEWYIKVAQQKLSDFKGVKRLTEYKKTELVDMAKELGIEFDPKIKKDELIKLIEKGKSDKKRTNVTDSNEGKTYNVKDITGNRYGHLVVLGLNHVDNYHHSYWNCRCDCGNEFVRIRNKILINRINSCNKCDYIKLEKQQTTTHGDSSKNSPNHRLYNIWRGMKKRCYERIHPYYYRYGGRGITICDEWLGSDGYMNFKKWALTSGYKDNLTIERKDYDGNYCPENCCWITMLEQHKNTSKVIKIPYNGKIYTMHEFCIKFHTSYETVRKYIINQGWSAEKYMEYINNKKKGND